MIIRDISFSSPEDNIVFDEVLLKLAEQNSSEEVLRFWESPQTFIVLGRVGKINDDVKKSTVLRDKIPVLRRSSGGGTVVQGPGCLNYTTILNKEKTPSVKDLKCSYEYILGSVVSALKSVGIEATYLPISDIALAGTKCKCSGNAQKRGRNYILHHGTLLYDFPLAHIEQYLTIPKDMPEYRHNRNHLEFVENVAVSAEDFKSALCNVFKATEFDNQVSEVEHQLIAEIKSAGNTLVEF